VLTAPNLKEGVTDKVGHNKNAVVCINMQSNPGNQKGALAKQCGQVNSATRMVQQLLSPTASGKQLSVGVGTA